MTNARDDGTRGELSKPAKPSPRQLEILRLIAKGYSGPKAAEVLGIAYSTLKNHVTRLLWVLGAKTAAHAVAIAKDRGLI